MVLECRSSNVEHYGNDFAAKGQFSRLSQLREVEQRIGFMVPDAQIQMNGLSKASDAVVPNRSVSGVRSKWLLLQGPSFTSAFLPPYTARDLIGGTVERQFAMSRVVPQYFNDML